MALNTAYQAKTTFVSAIALGAALVSFAACGSDPPQSSSIDKAGAGNGPVYGNADAGSGSGNGGSQIFVNGGGSGGATGGATGGTGTTGTRGSTKNCVGSAAAAEALPVDMYIMLDRSTSMGEPLGGDPSSGSKWEGVVSAIQAFVQAPEAAGIGVGIQYFGLPDVCNPVAYSTPEVPIGRLPGVATDIINSTNAQGPTTLTPTYPALEGALDHMKTWAQSHPERQSVVVLATDGFPTQCGKDEDTPACPNCSKQIADLETLAKQYADADPPILTFVVGLDGVENLRTIARAGGSGDAFLIDSGDIQGQFLNAMLSIASTPLSCQFDIPKPPSDAQVIDPNLVQVLYRPAVGDEREIPKLGGLGDCSINMGQGWYYDSPTDPTQILICPGTCKDFSAGSVAFNVGCKPLTPGVE